MLNHLVIVNGLPITEAKANKRFYRPDGQHNSRQSYRAQPTAQPMFLSTLCDCGSFSVLQGKHHVGVLSFCTCFGGFDAVTN